MADDDDDDEGFFGSVYENGHWEWDNNVNGLEFVSDLQSVVDETTPLPLKTAAGAIEFRDDVDLLEQVRFRRRYQRKLKPGQADVISLQDVKDIVIFTAPIDIMTTTLIDVLHIPTTERFIRALIFYMQYSLQVVEEMEERILELETKIRTPDCEILERELRDNLSDIRVVLAKEYCTMLIGGGDTRKYHHMGPQKKRKSLSDKDARFFETFLRLCVQIVWLALGRNSFNVIELEINRIFKSEIFNAVEHTINTGILTKMPKLQLDVVLGVCLRVDKKLTTRSPLMNEVTCHRPIDYRTMGLGVVECPKITNRLQYLLRVVAGAEEELYNKYDMSLGIIGLPRSGFDTMLHPLPMATKGSKSRTKQSIGNTQSSSARKSTIRIKLYKEITFPTEEFKEPYYPPQFPSKTLPVRSCNETQRLRWTKRLLRLQQTRGHQS